MEYIHLNIGPKDIGTAYMLKPSEGELIHLPSPETGVLTMYKVTSVQQELRPAGKLKYSYDLIRADVVLEEIAEVAI